METQAVTVTEQGGAVQMQSATMSLKQIADRVNLVHQVLEKVLKKGTHYGTVPGCGAKLVLLKPGADVLAMTFRLVPQFKVDRTDIENGHREYDVTCSMFGPSGELLGQGVGSASTMEKKYRYRKDDRGGKIENEDIADVYNTVLKIAKKRAHIDATLTVTGAADLFTQDLIDDDEPQRAPVAMPTERPKAEPASAPAPEHGTEAGDAVLTVEGEIVKAGSKPSGKGTRYWIMVDDQYYSTFSDSLGKSVVELKGESVRVEYKVVSGAKGPLNQLIDVALLRDDPQPEPEANPEELPV